MEDIECRSTFYEILPADHIFSMLRSAGLWDVWAISLPLVNYMYSDASVPNNVATEWRYMIFPKVFGHLHWHMNFSGIALGLKWCLSTIASTLLWRLLKTFKNKFMSLTLLPVVHFAGHTDVAKKAQALKLYSRPRFSIKLRSGLFRKMKFICAKIFSPCFYGPGFVHRSQSC